MTVATETRAFEAEVSQVLHLVTHSLYSHKEIFLRELISNASDACDKLRFEALNNAALYEDQPNLEVRISFDPEAKTITISDNGIGLSSAESVANLGTIAKSGTREFMSALEGDQKKDAQLIGQFGVGFYSGFIVADRLTVESRRAGLKRCLSCLSIVASTNPYPQTCKRIRPVSSRSIPSSIVVSSR